MSSDKQKLLGNLAKQSTMSKKRTTSLHQN